MSDVTGPQPLPAAQRAGTGFRVAVGAAVTSGVHIDLDGAGAAAERYLSLPRIEARAWGPKLRYFAAARHVEAFWTEIAPQLRSIAHTSAPFVLFGSGDFHHLTLLWQRAIVQGGAYHLVSFDNHPDWDVRPPRWVAEASCGGWLAHALRNPQLKSATVWGCANFELDFPSRLWRRRDPRLTVRPWKERRASSSGPQAAPTPRSPAELKLYRCFDRTTFRDEFARFAESLAGKAAYITVDLDCLTSSAAVTNWEPGLFEVADVAWALRELRRHAMVIGGDLCGAWSEQRYDGWFQRAIATWDHPKIGLADLVQIWRTNAAAMVALWGAMTRDPAAPTS